MGQVRTKYLATKKPKSKIMRYLPRVARGNGLMTTGGRGLTGDARHGLTTTGGSGLTRAGRDDEKTTPPPKQQGP